jgi:hypothetical protein
MAPANVMVSDRPPKTRRWAKGVAALLAGTVLALVFGLYARADFMLQLANQLWSCI